MTIGQDFRFALRMMLKKPLFAAVVILTLGICIGAVTAVYSVVDATLLRPLPFPEPEKIGQLVIRSAVDGRGGMQESQDGATWEVFSKSATTIDLAAYSEGVSNLNFASGGKVGYIHQQRVGSGFFRVFGIAPVIGREFSAEEDVPNGPPVAVLSHHLWKGAFASDAAIIGRIVTIAGLPYQIVGIGAPNFESEADLWTPLRPSRKGEGQGINYTIAGRLRSGASWAQAEAEMASIGQSIIQQRHLRAGVTAQYGLMPLQEVETSDLASSLWIALGAAVLVLVIGCVNIAGMLIARGSSRTGEIATRMALGASRGAIARQLLIESLVLALGGGIVGIGIGYFGLDLMKTILPTSFSALQSAELNVRVLTAMAAISLITSLVFGLLPALQAGRADIRSAQTGRGVVGPGRSYARRALSVIQVAFAVAVLIGAGLLTRSFRYLYDLKPGFDATHVITANFALLDARYSSAAVADRYFKDVLSRLHEVPGIESAAVAQSMPYERGMNTVFTKPGEPSDQYKLTNLEYTSPEFFDALRIPILKGRGITDADGADATPVIVINQAFAAKYFKNEDPLGSEIVFGPDKRQIVGIAGDVLQQAGWGGYGPMGWIPGAYIPTAQSAGFGLRASSPSWIVRTSGPPEAVQKQIQAAVEAVDPLLPIASFRSLEQIHLRSLGLQRFRALLLGIAAGLSLLLAGIGTYAMISNLVAERTRELGIRLALGAKLRQAVFNAVTPALICAVLGIGVGMFLARSGARFLEGMLYGVTPVDEMTYLAVAAAVALIVVVASLIPALRITKLDPAQTLRLE